MFDIKSVRFDDLTEEEQKEQPDNGSGKECAGYLKLTHDGDTIGIFSDAMEPEDCSFGRDLKWVRGIIEGAYELGLEDRTP